MLSEDECPLVCPDTGYAQDSRGVRLCECANHTITSALHPTSAPRPCAGESDFSFLTPPRSDNLLRLLDIPAAFHR